MAPRKPKAVKPVEPSSDSEDLSAVEGGVNIPELEEGTEDSDIADLGDAQPAGEEYHTEEGSDAEDDDDDQALALTVPSSTLLPAHLLKPASSTQPTPSAASIPHNQLTAKQKKAQRSRSRQAKKRMWDRLREQTKGSGVLEAGKAAQVKRGVLLGGGGRRDKVRSGRVGKRQVSSGRQQLLEQRKRVAAGKEGVVVSGPGKRVKGGSKG